MGASLAQKKTQRLGGRFPNLFRQQYVLSRQSNLTYPRFSQHPLMGWMLYAGRAMRVVRLLDRNERHIGFVLGIVLRDGALLAGDITVPAAAEDDTFEDALDQFVYGLAGRYIVIVLTERVQSLYPDPVCDMPVVFDPEHQIVGSSLSLILHRPFRPNPHFNLHNILRGRNTFTLQHTADAGVHRALPNHALYLSNFESRRHWPKEGFQFNDSNCDVDKTLSEMIDRLGQNFGALVSNFPSVVPVTGGRDSRILVSCGRSHLDHAAEFSAYRFHNASAIDGVRGRMIMERLGYDFKDYRKRPVSRRTKSLFHLKTGYTGIRGEFQALGSTLSYPQDHLILRSNIMELLRANQWRQRHIDHGFIRVHAFKRLKAGITKTNRDFFTPAYEKWRSSLPESLQERPYDMGFVEMLLPNTQGAYFNGFHNNFFINPFNDRYLIGRSIQLPVQMRRDDVFAEMLIERSCPELLDIPFH